MQYGQAAQFPAVTTFYSITGEECYNEHGFTTSFPVEGLMKVTLNPVTTSIINYDSSSSIKNSETGYTLENSSETGVLVNRVQSDGNYTAFFVSIPTSHTQPIHDLFKTVDAYYQGERYIEVNGKFFRTHYFLYAEAEMQTILRCEWFFDWDTGVLLEFIKSIEVNFIRVQWRDYKVINTTLTLTSSHPIMAFLTNFRDNIYAIIGAIIVATILFYYLIQKKVQRVTES